MAVYTVFLAYLSAYNNHDVEKVVSFLHPDCQVIFDGKSIAQGVEAMRVLYEKDFLDPQAKATLLEHNEDATENDRIRVTFKTHDHRLIDVTYVFNTNEEEGEINNKNKMIKHIIHSVQHIES